MPPKSQPKVYQILVRSHKVTVFLTRAPESTIQELKEEARAAMSSDVVSESDLPSAPFEVCKLISKKGSSEYQVLDDSKQIKDCGIGPWEVLYLQFQDPETNQLLDVEYTPLPDFDDEEAQPETPVKGKRKATDFD